MVRNGRGGLTFPSYAFMEFFREVQFPFVRLREVDMDVEAATLAVGDGMDEFRIGFAFRFCWRIDERLPIRCFLTVSPNVSLLCVFQRQYVSYSGNGFNPL